MYKILFLFIMLTGHSREYNLLYSDLGKSPVINKFKKIAIEAFREAGYQLNLHPCPSQRCLKLLETQRYDGSLYRVQEFLTSQRKLFFVKIDAPILRSKFHFYYLDPNKNFEDWKHINKSNYSILAPNGMIFLHQVLSKQVKAEQITYTYGGLNSLVSMLASKRADAFFFSDVIENNHYNGKHFSEFRFRKSKLNYEAVVYTFLKKEHRELAVKLKPIYERLIKNNFGRPPKN